MTSRRIGWCADCGGPLWIGGCVVCALAGMTSSEVTDRGDRDRDSDVGNMAYRDAEKRIWRGREDEANAWPRSVDEHRDLAIVGVERATRTQHMIRVNIHGEDRALDDHLRRAPDPEADARPFARAYYVDRETGHVLPRAPYIRIGKVFVDGQWINTRPGVRIATAIGEIEHEGPYTSSQGIVMDFSATGGVTIISDDERGVMWVHAGRADAYDEMRSRMIDALGIEP